MELVEVEAVEDRSRPEGGHAVIVLRGADGLPASARFRLQAVDADTVLPEARALLERTHEPLGVRMTEDGIALEIGPGLADTAFLVPGMALEITLVDAGLRGEFLWPAVTPLARPKRRNIMTRRSAGEVPAAAGAPASPMTPVATRPAQITPVPAPALSQGTADKPAPLPPVPLPPVPLVVEAMVEPAPAETLPRRSIVVASLRPGPAAAPANGSALPESVAAEALAMQSWVEAPAPSMPAPSPAPSPPPAPAISGKAPTISVPPRADVPLETPARKPAPAPVVLPSPPSAKARADIAASSPGRWTPASAAAVAVAALLGLQLVGFGVFDLRVVKRAQAPIVAAPAPAVRASQPGIYDVLATEPVSPRGLAADGISPARALQLAHVYQHGPEAGRDRDEAIYWLKRYVISTTGSENTRIALTQLGSAYARPAARGSARPDTGPDMRRATAAWELAAAMGDTVAMCFLATVHERGMGVPADRAAAAAWTARANRSGGCAATATSTTIAPR